MMKNKWIGLSLLAVGLMMLGWATVSDAVVKDVQRISKEELKAQLGNADVLVLDVRSGKDWTSSELKIKGAVREDPKDFEAWSMKYPKEKKIVIYCA